MKKRYKILIAIGLFLCIILFFLSSVLKWYVVKNSKSLTGRKISIESIHFNYLKVAVRIKDIVMYEASGKDTFVSAGEIYVNYDPWALLKKEYAFSEISLKRPRVTIIQDGDHFNFDDFMKKDSLQPSKKADTTSSNIRFLIKNFRLSGGVIQYSDVRMKNKLVLRNLNLDVPKIAWDSNQSDVGVGFRIGENGIVKISAKVNNQKHLYSINLETQTLDLNIITNYLKSYLNISSLNGLLTTRTIISGNIDSLLNINIRGYARVNGLSVIDNLSNPVMMAKSVEAWMKNLDLGRFRFDFSSISSENFQLMAVIDKKQSNLMNFLQPYFTSDSLSRLHTDSTAVAASAPLTYAVDTIVLNNASVHLKDNSLNRPFAYDLKKINLIMKGLTESSEDIPVDFEMILNERGKLKGNYHLNMKNPGFIKTQLIISGMDLVSFSPYSEYYIASPIVQGSFSYDMSLVMSSTRLDIKNNIDINQLQFGKKTHDTTAVKVPIRLALYIIKDVHNHIKIDLPVIGNPSEPKFSLSRLIWKTVGNFCIKVAAEPFKAMSGLVGSHPESLNKMKFEPGQDSMNAENLKLIHELAELIRKKPELKLMFIQYTNSELEKGIMAVQFAKTKYARMKNPTADSLKIAELIQKVTPEDPDFKTFLATNVVNGASMETEKACLLLAGEQKLNEELLIKINRRNWSLQKALGMQENLPESSFHVETADLRNVPEELKNTLYKIEVSLNE